MKNINKELIKNVCIGFLIIIALVLLLMIVFYNKISIGRVIPKVESYQLSEEAKKELESENSDENSEIVTTYELDASDLKNYEKTKEYNKGKKNPFAAEETSSNNTNTEEEGTSDTNESTSSNSTNTNFYEDEGTK